LPMAAGAHEGGIIIIIIQFVTRQVPVSQILRHGGRYTTSQLGLIVKSNVKQMCL